MTNVGVMSLGTITLVPMRLVLHGTKEEYIPQFTFFQSGMVMGCLKFYGIITFFRSPCAVEACSFQLYKQCPLEATTWPFKVGQLCFLLLLQHDMSMKFQDPSVVFSLATWWLMSATAARQSVAGAVMEDLPIARDAPNCLG